MMSTHAEQLHLWIREWLGRELGVPSAELVADKSFVHYGLDSVHAMMLVGDLEEHLKRRLAPTLAWDHSTIEALAGHLAATGVAIAPDHTEASDLLARLDDLSEDELDRLLAEQHARQQPTID